MPNLVQDSTTSLKLRKRNTTEVPPPDINIPEAVSSGSVEHERTLPHTVEQEDKNNDFNERIRNLIGQLLDGKDPPRVNHPTAAAPVENVPECQEQNKVVDNGGSEENLKTRTEEPNLKLEKTRGGLKTRINIRRCTIEHETKGEQDKQNSRRQMRSFVKPAAPLGPENKKASDVSEAKKATDDEIETVSRKQSLRSQHQTKESSSQNQVKEMPSTQVRRETPPQEVGNESLPESQEKELPVQQENESPTQLQGIENLELQTKDNSPQQEKETPLQEEEIGEEGGGKDSTSEELAKDNPTVKLKIKMSDIKQSKSDHENEEKGDKKVKCKSSVEKKRITRASVVDVPVNECTPSDDTNTENTVSVKSSLRSRQRVSYVEALEEQFATFDSSESDDESLYKKAHNKKKKQPKNVKNLVSSTKETQVSENIFDCNVVISNVDIDQIQMKQTEMKQNNLKINKKQRSVSCENKDVLISKKSLRSLKSSPRSDKPDGGNREKSQSLSNLDQVTTATQSNPSSSFNNEFIDFLKNTVNMPESANKQAECKSTAEKENAIESIPSVEEQVSKEVIESEIPKTVEIVETTTEPCNIPLQEHTTETVGTAVQTDVTDIPTCLEETTTIVNDSELCTAIVSEPVTNSTVTNEDKPPQEESNNNNELNVALVDDAQNNASTPPVDHIESTITDVINASCIDHVASESDNPVTNTTTAQNTPFILKQTRKRTQIERNSMEEDENYEDEEENNCKKMKCSYDEQPSPIPFTELMIPEVVLTEDLPVSVNIGTMCDPIPSETRCSIPNPPVLEIKPYSKVIKHVDTCEKSVSTDVTKIQFSIYPDTTARVPSTISPSGNISTTVNKDMYNYFDGFNKHLSLYGTPCTGKKANYYDNEGNKSQHQKISKTTAPLFNSSTSSIRSVIQTKSVSSVSITPSHRTPVTVINYPSDDMPIDLSRKHTEKPIVFASRVIKPQETCIRRSTSTTPDCIAYKVATRDSTTPESGYKVGSSSTTPDSVYSSHDSIVPRAKNTNINTNTTQGRGKLYELPRQSPQTMQMMHTRLWDMQDLPYHSMLLNDNSNYQEHLPQAQLMNAPNLIPIQTLSPEYTAQRNLFIANQMYVSALQAFQDAASTSTSQKSSYAVPNRKRPDGVESGRRKKVRDVMTNVPVLSYEQLQQSNIGLERRLEENVFQYQSSSTATSQSTSTSVIQRTEVSSDQSTLTYIHNSPDEECLRPNILENYSTLQSYGLNSNIVSQIQNLSSNRLTKAKGKAPRR
uniref:Uncharacterized protein n=1 Tax=Cacopsylla melanoneura TaxID=428564 RepID=A0A8D8LKX6_9HEMI